MRWSMSALGWLALLAAAAGEAAVVDATLTPSGDGTWRIDATVEHTDEGWDHYADAWDVMAPDGTVLGTRKLLHPHETEQPLTGSLSGLAIPDGAAAVTSAPATMSRATAAGAHHRGATAIGRPRRPPRNQTSSRLVGVGRQLHLEDESCLHGC